jgi:uncharacterized membrane protein (DUF485 family)
MKIINCYNEKLRKEREAKEAAERKEQQKEYEVKFNLIFSSVMLVMAVPLAIIIVYIGWLSSGQPLYQEWINLKIVSAIVAEIIAIIYFVVSVMRYKKLGR